MFLDNKYTKTYFRLVAKAKTRGVPDRSKSGRAANYFEEHHIIPSAMGGPDTLENYAYLTGHEHFVAHLLLPKMTTGSAHFKMLSALNDMLRIPKSMQGKRYVPTGRTYEIAKKASADAHRGNKEIAAKISKSKTGKPLSEKHLASIRRSQDLRRGKKLNLSPEQRANRSAKAKGRKPTDATREKMVVSWIARRARQLAGLEPKRATYSEEALESFKVGAQKREENRKAGMYAPRKPVSEKGLEGHRKGIEKREENRRNGISYTKPRKPVSEEGRKSFLAHSRLKKIDCQQDNIREFTFGFTCMTVDLSDEEAKAWAKARK